MTTLTSTVTLNVPTGSQSLAWGNPTTLDSITYGSGVLTFPPATQYILSQSDFALYFSYNKTFFDALLLNFPAVYQSYQTEIPSSLFQIHAIPLANEVILLQQTNSPSLATVFNISFNTATLQATFSARSSTLSISPQEYLLSFPILQQYASQVGIS